MGQLGITYDTILSAVSGLKTEASRLENMNKELEKVQKNMQNYWSNDEATAFVAGYETFQKKLVELEKVILSIADWAQTTHDNYDDNEKKGSSFYKSIF